ncbi:SDR family NAD(P)-dependent oxidoreductase [Asaia krungthepensis]|uniref:Oxidoreductase n=1 Tax=Asaia krungthepensis NRIC 0535 TaxID=1307925 RepID=A0ABQ0PXN5_9PROT|nr:SDR family NAD(P)-dependent oxidoreductase [Asaia krungthepensis]GBQ84153.1 oxidoreductase [Asaia krungthepensis NRIC 0535]
MSRPERFAKLNFAPRHVLITGASGGLGKALACHYAQPAVQLTLWGRNESRLQAVADQCRARGSTVEIHSLALTDIDNGVSLLEACDDARPVDLLILNAGVSDIRPEGALTETVDAVREAALVNYAAPVTLATAAAARMAPRRYGRIAFIGSVAAHHDLPFASAYSSSKAGLSRFSTCLHAAMAPLGVGVTLVEPGYIDTAMSRRLDGARPFLISAEDAASRIAGAVAVNRAVLVFPRVFLVLKFLSALVPRGIAHRLLRLAEVKQRGQ